VHATGYVAQVADRVFLQWNLDDETEEDFRHAVCDVTDVSKAYFVRKIRVS